MSKTLLFLSMLENRNNKTKICDFRHMKKKNLKVGDIVNFEVYPLTNHLNKLWGTSKHLKIDAQKAKEELREEWN